MRSIDDTAAGVGIEADRDLGERIFPILAEAIPPGLGSRAPRLTPITEWSRRTQDRAGIGRVQVRSDTEKGETTRSNK